MTPDALLLAGLPAEAESAAREALAAEETPGARAALVRALVALGRPADAVEAVALLPREAPHARVAHALAALANGEPSRAKAILHAERQPDDLLVLLTAAEVTRAAGDAAQAVQHAGRARTLAEDLDEPRWVAAADLQLARCVADAGDTGLGRTLAGRAHAAFRVFCPDTVLEADALDVCGALARKDGEPEEAVGFHERALDVWRAAVGEDHPLLAGCHYSLAQALHRSDERQRALTEMQRAFLLTQRAFGPDHLDTWITRFELGRMEVDNGEMFDGFPRMEAARAEVARRLGRQHPIVRAMDRFL